MEILCVCVSVGVGMMDRLITHICKYLWGHICLGPDLTDGYVRIHTEQFLFWSQMTEYFYVIFR